MEIESDPKLNQWFNNIEASDNTKSLYTLFMKVYCECINKTPSELINEAIQDIKAGLMPAERKEAEYLPKFKDCLKKKGYADKSFQVALATVRSFYKNFDITLPNGASKNKKAKPKKENQTFLYKSDIKKLIVNAKNLREKSVILMMATSGMAIQEIVNLQIKDIDIDSENIGTITVRRQKTAIDYTTFISPEAVIALQNYLEERNRNIFTKIKSKNDLVIVSYGNNNRGGKINKLVLCKHFKLLGEELGYESEGTGKDNRKGIVKSRSHAFRKFFATSLETAGMPKNKIDYMLGHVVNDVDSAYFKTDIPKLKELYKTYLPHLTFEKTIEVRSLNTEDAKELKALKDENQEIKKELATTKEVLANINEFLFMLGLSNGAPAVEDIDKTGIACGIDKDRLKKIKEWHLKNLKNPDSHTSQLIKVNKKFNKNIPY